MDVSDVRAILAPEDDVETAIVTNELFMTGCDYGTPRRGHPEGKVIYHIKEVLDNVNRYYEGDSMRTDLRAIAIVHDTFKFQVDSSKPKTGANHHGHLARRFLEQFIFDEAVLEVTELHDEAYNSWRQIAKKGVSKAEERALKLAIRLGRTGSMPLYLAFYKCDNATGDKESDNFVWFNEFLFKFSLI